METRPPCAPACPISGGRTFVTPAVTQGRICPRCGATLWSFPEDHGPGTEVRIAAAEMAAARGGRVEALMPAMLEAHRAGWWVAARDWARHLEEINPDLVAWHRCFADTPGVREGLTALIEERGFGVATPPALTFERVTRAVPPAARRARHGLCNLGAPSGDALVLSVRGPTAAEAGLLCRWRRDAEPEVLRRDAVHAPLGGELWSEETPAGVTLLRIPPRGPAVVLATDASRRHLSGQLTVDGRVRLQWFGGPAVPEAGVMEFRTYEGLLCAPPAEAPAAPRHPLDDGYARRIVPRGHCWAREGVVHFAPPEGRPGWQALGGFEWAAGSERFFVLRGPAEAAPHPVQIVDAVTGARSGVLSLPRPPTRLTALAMGEAVFVVADARCARISPQDAEPRWAKLPFAAEVALGEAAGPFAVLLAHDDRERFLVVEATPAGIRMRGEVRGLTPVRSGGFGPVFLADDFWGAVAWGPLR